MDVIGGQPEPATGRLGVLRRFLRRPVLMDVVVVVLVLGLARAQETEDLPGVYTPWMSVFDLALALPLLWRRRRPALVFAIISLVALLQWLTATQAGGDFAVLVALFALGGYERRRRFIAAGVVVAQVGIVLAVLRWAPIEHRFSAATLLTGTVTAAWVLGVYTRTRRAYLSSVLERAATAERERDQQAMLAVAAERSRISQEMHDIVAHSLSVMIALSDGAGAAIERDPEAARTTMGQASALGRQALGEVRRLLSDEHTPNGLGDGEMVPQPGIAQIDDLVAQVRCAGLPVDLRVSGEPAELAPGAQLAVYRMIQEALTNVLKHAPAAEHATVSLRYHRGGVVLEVENDDTSAPQRRMVSLTSAGRGLTGMRERAAVFGGTVDFGRRNEGGWRIVSHLPLEEAPR
ncbi:MAG: sensor histidine kinase [Janthinobacterium lividum]